MVSPKKLCSKNLWHCVSYFADRKISVQGLQKLSEKEVTKLVANHLLGRLATSAYYLVDKNSIGQKGDQCFCGENLCKITGHYWDTSVGKSFQKLKQRWKDHRFIYNCCCKMWIYMKSLPEYIRVRVFSTWSVLKHTPLLIVVYVHHFKVMNRTEGLDIFVLICKRVFIGVTILLEHKRIKILQKVRPLLGQWLS